MPPTPNAWTAALFGSTVRAEALAVLASSSVPLTAYAVAKIAGLPIPRTYATLDRLATAGVLLRSRGSKGATCYEMVDTDLRGLLRRREPLYSWEEWIRRDAEGRRVPLPSPRASRSIDLDRFEATPQDLPNWREFLRPREKDEDLRRGGGRVSRRPRRGE